MWIAVVRITISRVCIALKDSNLADESRISFALFASLGATTWRRRILGAASFSCKA
ncbi:protein of unknown function (plasmid) [Pseudorhizobium banfieldiae]|uniref:Uncharacterized protein n=1 Tax=Pseudorhizobium banfieldiae TaxID=1125847 RepID=L0NMH9_9HYPH|nr:protein of unknown function [Pseudorhizobium banfieldiae]